MAAPPWDELLEGFCNAQTRHTGRAYRTALADFRRSCSKAWDQVDALDVYRWRDQLREHAAAATIRARIAALSAWYKFLMRPLGADGTTLVRANPAAGIKTETVQVYGRARRIDRPEFLRILEAIPGTPQGLRDRSLILAYVHTARRRAELARLTWGDLERRGSSWFYRYRGKRGKGARPRQVPPDVVRAIAAWAGEEPRDPSDRIWPIAESTISRRLKSYARKAGVDVERVHVHGLRHLGAQLRLEAMRRKGAVDLQVLQDFLDHGSLAVTQVYMAALEEDRDELADDVSDLLRGPGDPIA